MHNIVVIIPVPAITLYCLVITARQDVPKKDASFVTNYLIDLHNSSTIILSLIQLNIILCLLLLFTWRSKRYADYPFDEKEVRKTSVHDDDTRCDLSNYYLTIHRIY